MRRRELLVGTAAGTALAAPALAQGRRRLRMVTDWPEGPGLLASAQRLAQSIAAGSAGRIEVEVFAAGALVRPFEAFDAVEAGLADMLHTHLGYYRQRAAGFDFYSGLPFGLTTQELFAWIRFGGGQALWDELALPLGIRPLACSSTGAQMGGWYRTGIGSVADFQGLRYRMAGPGAEVYRRLGAAAVLLAPSEILPALRSGAIDACEWSGPWLDTLMGLDRVARYYYYPGWHEPGGVLTLGIARRVWDGLEADARRLVETACAAEFATALAEFNTENARALARIRQEGHVELRRFDDAILAVLARLSAEVVAEAGAGSALAGRIHASYMQFGELAGGWSAITEGAYLEARGRLGARGP